MTGGMYVCSTRFELFFPMAHSLKERRAIVRPVVDGLRNRFSVSVAEVGDAGKWQRASVGVAVVGSSVSLVEHVLDDCDRFVWSFPELEVISTERTWSE
jgi:uncharacterized protein